MVAPPRLQRVTVGEAVTKYLRTYEQKVQLGQSSQHTLVSVRRMLRDFQDIVGPDTVLDDVTGDDVDEVVSSYALTPDRRRTATGQSVTTRSGIVKSKASQNLFYARLSAFFTAAKKRGWVQDSPMLYTALARMVKVKKIAPSRRALMLDQAEALVAHGAGEHTADMSDAARHNHYRDRAAFALMVFLGPRVSEVADASVDDVAGERDGGAVWTIIGKGDKQRQVPVSPQLYAYLQEYWAVRQGLVDSGYLPESTDLAAMFSSSRGNRWSQRGIERALDQARARLAAREDTARYARAMVPHALRHTAATLMSAAGWDVKVIAEMLGHDNIATTSKYLDQIPGELKAAVSSHPLAKKLVPVAS